MDSQNICSYEYVFIFRYSAFYISVDGESPCGDMFAEI